MGIENRDYARGSSSGYDGGYASYGGYGTGMPPACKWILIITIAVFVLQIVLTGRPSESQVSRYREQVVNAVELRGEDPANREDEINYLVKRYAQEPYSIVQRAFQLAPDKVFPGFQVWRLVTYAFCHSIEGGLPWHIIFNMLALWFFGPTLERMYGTREFTWFYLMGAVVSGLVFMILEQFFLGNLTPVIGASGAVMAVLMLYAIHYPRQIIRIWGIIPIEVRWIVGIFIIVDLFPVLQSLGGRVVGDNVAHSAHLGGLAFGYLYYKFQLRFDRFFGNFRLPEMSSKRPVSRGNLRLYEPPENFDKAVDEILEKISKEGESSLSEQERELLKAASQKYKKRP